MALLDCGPDRYPSKDGSMCCDRCPAGKYVSSECDASTKTTTCDICRHGTYMAKENHMNNCFRCRDCSSHNHIIAKDCKADENRQCECVTGFYCMEDDCVRCQAVTHCPVGEGVKVASTRRTDTECVKCPLGTYSNVSDYHSRCQTHTSCDDLGRVLKTHGTSQFDAVCGDIKCTPWVLPVGLWAALALTSLLLLIVLLSIIYWRVKRKSYRPAIPSDPDVTVVPVTPTQSGPVQLSFPSREWDGHCQESAEEKDCTSPLYVPDDTVINRFTLDSVVDGPPMTPVTASFQFVQSSHINGNAGNCTSRLMRNHSEPQEDEWVTVD